ncbi:MAG: hypothetical protein ABIQ88_01700 [Chitinophagaceae bacterium]
MIKASIFYGLLCLFIVSCKQHTSTRQRTAGDSTTTYQNETPAIVNADSSTIAILSVKEISFFSLKDSIPATLSQAERQTIEALLTHCVKQYNAGTDSTKLYAGYIDLKKYKRQYAAYSNIAGEKKVFINCFCAGLTAFNEWKEKLVEVDDGGVCFFNVTINVTMHTCGPVLINGPG